MVYSNSGIIPNNQIFVDITFTEIKFMKMGYCRSYCINLCLVLKINWMKNCFMDILGMEISPEIFAVTLFSRRSKNAKIKPRVNFITRAFCIAHALFAQKLNHVKI